MDGESPENAYSDDELYALFRKLFPCGLAEADVREELDAEDWEDSPFFDLGANWPAIRSMIRRARNKRTDAQIARELGALAADGGEWQGDVRRVGGSPPHQFPLRRRYVEEALRRCNGNVQEAADLVGVHRNMIARILKCTE